MRWGSAAVRAPPDPRSRIAASAYALWRSRHRISRRVLCRAGEQWRRRQADNLLLHLLDLRFAQRLGLEQRRGGTVKQRAVLLQNRGSLLEGLVDKSPHRAVDRMGRVFAVAALLRHRVIRLEEGRAVAVVGHVAESLA